MGISSSRPKTTDVIPIDDASRPREPISWDDLPQDVLHTVFEKAAEVGNVRELEHFALVSKQWKACVDHPHLWEAAAKGLRLPEHPRATCRKAVERACAIDHHMRTGKPTNVQVIQHQDVFALAFSPDGSNFATASRDGTVLLTDVYKGASPIAVEQRSSVGSMSFSSNGSKLATGSFLDKMIWVWDVRIGATSQHRPDDIGLSFSLDQTMRATASQTGPVIFTDDQTVFFNSTYRPPCLLCPSPRGDMFAFADNTGAMQLINPSGGTPFFTVQNSGRVSALCFNRDGGKIAAGTNKGKVFVTDTSSRTLLFSSADFGSINQMLFSSNGNKLAFGTYDGKVALADMESNKTVTLADHASPITALPSILTRESWPQGQRTAG